MLKLCAYFDAWITSTPQLRSAWKRATYIPHSFLFKYNFNRMQRYVKENNMSYERWTLSSFCLMGLMRDVAENSRCTLQKILNFKTNFP